MNTLFSDEPSPDGLLYHYTSQPGLLGIIQSRQIWATNLLFLNDPMELNYAIQLVQNNIDKIKETLPQKDAKFVSEFSEHLNEINYADTQSFEAIYVCSFSENGNQLSQWRGYCPDGSGFSIGFDFKSQLKNIVEKQGFRLVKCIYDKNKQSDIIESFIKRTLDDYHSNDDYDTSNNFSTMRSAWENFFDFAPVLKHPKFEEEQEWRLICKPKGLYDVKFRPGKSMLIPYTPINISNVSKESKRELITWIPEIWIGPTPHPRLSYISLENMLRTGGIWRIVDKFGMPLQGSRIFVSEIPYRAW